MLNGLKVKISTGGGMVPLPDGMYTAQVMDVNFLEKHVTSFAPQGKDFLEYKFAILDEVAVEGGTTRGRNLWDRMSPSLNEKARMFKLVKAIVGAEGIKTLRDFDPETLVGKQVMVVVENTPSKDGMRTFANIANYLPVRTPLAPFPAEEQGNKEVVKETKPLVAGLTPSEVLNAVA